MPWPKKDGKAKRLYELYKMGLSLSHIAKKEGMSRQAVYGLFQYRRWPLRTMPRRVSFLWNGDTYSLRNNGYYGKTIGGRTLLHRDVWELNKGPIPKGYDIHHIDGNKANNFISNLECLSKSEHTRLYSPHHNQYTKRKSCGSS